MLPFVVVKCRRAVRFDTARRVFLLRSGAAVGAFGTAGLIGCGPARNGVQPWAEVRVLEQRDTRFGRLSVVEVGRKRYLAYGNSLQLVYQSVLDLDRPHELAAPYTQLMMLGVVYAQPYARMVQVGVGAGNMSGYAIRNFPAVVLDAVDIDRHAVELGARYFGLAPHPRLRLHIEDGRRWLLDAAGPFDVVMLDAYDDQSIPPMLKTGEFFKLVASRLAPGGTAMQNVCLPIVDVPRLLGAVRAAFAQVDLYRSGDNAVLAAYQGAARPADALARRARELDDALRPVHALANLLGQRVSVI